MLRICVSNQQQQRTIDHPAGPLEFGRIPKRGVNRVVLDDPHVSRNQLRIRERSGSKLLVENLSERIVCYLPNGEAVNAGESQEVDLPVRISVGATVLDILLSGQEDSARAQNWHTIQQPVRPTGVSLANRSLAGMGESILPQTLAHWFETVISVQRSAAGSQEFYSDTARAVVELVGLDRGMVLLRNEISREEWRVVASHSVHAGVTPSFSRTILDRMVREGRTFFQPSEIASQTGSMMGVEAVVVSPVFDERDTVVGAVYGLRAGITRSQNTGIQPLEAQVVQLLAAAVGVGLARQQREAEAARSRVQFEQFFSSALAQELERDPTLLDGRDRAVTILFADLRGFSGLSEKLDPADTFRLVNDAMEMLTKCVLDHSGVLVDYVGDGLLAMWNAPTDVPDHATLACEAALAMLDCLPKLTLQWEPLVRQSLGLGIGINTGEARVGNAGSSRRFKYAPLGHAVNLASRVQGATSQLGVQALITESTKSLLQRPLATRRLCQARLQGISTPVSLHELFGREADPQWQAMRNRYEQGLSLFESGQWDKACQELAHSTTEFPRMDLPTLTLIKRVTECLQSPPASFVPVFDLKHK